MPPPSSPTRGSTRSSSPPTVSTVSARDNNVALHPPTASIEQRELTISLEDPATHSSYLSALRQIDRIPVPDLASTLTNPAEDEVNEVNLSFLRTPIEPREQPRMPDLVEQHRQRINRMSDSWRSSTGDDRGRRERLERVLAQLNRMHSSTPEGRPHASPQEQQSSGHHNDVEDDREIMAAISRLREIHPNTAGEVLRVMAQNQLERQREHRQRYISQADPSLRSQSDALRSTAILQAVRRHPRFSSRSREYFGERSREHQLERTPVDHSIQTDYYDRRQNAGQATQDFSGYSTARLRPRARRMILSETEPASAINDLLQDSLLYLAKLRSSCSYEDGVSHALRAGFNYKDFIDQTFVLDLSSIPPPPPTSLLAPGAMFTGSQHGNTPSPEYLPESSMTGLQYGDNSLAPTSGPPAGYVPWDTRRQSTGPYDFSSGQVHAQSVSRMTSGTVVDRWPVKVTIFDVDYDRMTLTASMEAYEVPSHPPSAHSPTSQCNPSSHQQKSIATYLEGEILDLRTHTFVTENFTSTLARDLTHWRKLPPFNSIPAAELPRRLVSRDFLTQISEQYVLMRWKERCFVQQSVRTGNVNRFDHTAGDSISEPDGCGLTISGFYYVSLRRQDGLVEGLYSDPASSPFQYLRLGRVKGGGFPAWSFK